MLSTGGRVSPSVTNPRESRYWRCPSLLRISKARVDFPEPERPVKTTNLLRGISRSRFLRLCKRALRRLITESIFSPLRFGFSKLNCITLVYKWRVWRPVYSLFSDRSKSSIKFKIFCESFFWAYRVVSQRSAAM